MQIYTHLRKSDGQTCWGYLSQGKYLDPLSILRLFYLFQIGSGISRGGGSWYREGGGVKEEPFFKVQEVKLNVTAVEGRQAALVCSVHSLRDKQVD